MATRKRALITGITGQDGAYLAEFLIGKGYEVHGVKRRTSLFNTDRIDHLYQDPHIRPRNLILHHGDMTDSSSLIRIMQDVQPDEIYNLAAQSHVAVSFEEPEYTADSDALGALRLLEAMRILRMKERTRFYQAGTSEMFGLVQETPQKETTPFYPRSPYGVAKLYAHWITVNYRESYGFYACNGILFNHECIAIDTPLIVRASGAVNVVTPDELVSLRRKGPNIQHFDAADVEVWDGRDWTRILGITATKRRTSENNHTLISVQARAGAITCTRHHMLIRADEKEVRADMVRPGESLLLAATLPSSPAWTVLTEEFAEFLGLIAADGYVPETERTTVQFTNNDPDLQQRISQLWARLFLGAARFAHSPSGFGKTLVAQTYLTGAGAAIVQWLRTQLYSSKGFKRVPPLILNADPAVQAAFLRGYYAGDGLKAGNGDSIKTNSPLLAQGLYWLYANQGRLASVYVHVKDDHNYYQLNVPTANPCGNKGQHLRKPAAEIRAIDCAAFGDDEWVIDLETQSGRFMAGIGRIVVHNSPIRGETFVTRKTTRALARIALGLDQCLYLGNLNAKRDWGHAKDYVEMQWLMLQQKAPEDYVIATGQQRSVREFVEVAARELGIELAWRGKGVKETGIVAGTRASKALKPAVKKGDVIVRVDPRYFRPAEVETLLGDATKARRRLGWKPRIGFDQLVREMMRSDLHDAQRDVTVRDAGFRTHRRHE